MLSIRIVPIPLVGNTTAPRSHPPPPGALRCVRVPNAEDGDESGMGLPTRNTEEFKPFIRRLPEFKFWLSAQRATMFAFGYGNFDIIFGRLSRLSFSPISPHTCGVLYLVPMLIGC